MMNYYELFLECPLNVGDKVIIADREDDYGNTLTRVATITAKETFKESNPVDVFYVDCSDCMYFREELTPMSDDKFILGAEWMLNQCKEAIARFGIELRLE